MSTTFIARRLAVARTRARTLYRDDQGAVTILFALCGGMMIATMCLALDTINDSMSLSRMQSALDVATLTAGAETGRFSTITGSNLAQWQADARAYYNANMTGGYANVSMPDKNFTATLTSDSSGARTLALSATGTLSLIAPVTLGKSGLTVSTTDPGTVSSGTTDSGLSMTTATVAVSNAAIIQPKSTLELVMVLDNTGSMNDAINGVTKMDGLQAAAKTLVSNLLASTTADSHIGLVPFTTTVNVKGALSAGGSWLSPKFTYNSTNVQMATDSKHDGWGGCTVEPRDANGYLAAKAYSPITSPRFTPYYYNVPSAGLTVRTYKNDQLCGTLSTSTKYTGVPLSLGSGYLNYCGFSGSDIRNGIATYFDQTGTVSSTSTPTQTQNSGCIGQPVTFLTNDSSTLNTAINGMSPKGDTIIPMGILWGWRMLSSSWSKDNASGNGWISTDTSYPKPETTQNLQRVMIVLTDGENNVGARDELPNYLYFNGLSGVGTNLIPAPTIARTDGTTLANATMDYSETVALPASGKGTSTDINTFQLGVCNAVKASGITVYAITFGSVSTVAAATMQSCASSGNYYHAPDSATLNTIFTAIAGNLGILRLTQ
ncbi:MAG: VWA domain-containing protein [Janthinobacterium lividum]